MGVSVLWDQPDRDPVLLRDDQGQGPLVAGKKGKGAGKKVVLHVSNGSPRKSREGSTDVNLGDVYVPNWNVKVGDNLKSSVVCEDVLTHFARLMVRDSMAAVDDDLMISRMMMGASNFSSSLPEGVSRFHKRVQKYEEFSKRRRKFCYQRLQVKAERAALVVQRKAFPQEKEGLKASLAKATSDNQLLIEHGFQQVVTYILHSTEFNSVLGDVQPQDQSSFFHPQAFEVFKECILNMEQLTYPCVGEASNCFGKPLSVLQKLKPSGLNEVVCAEVLKLLDFVCPTHILN
ncbi:hypothetical protein Hanom_Chr16g01463431 [Helianthus anomalus]